MAAGEENVLGSDVPVHDVLSVGVGECVGDLARDPDGVPERHHPLALQAPPQAFALYIGHDVEQVLRPPGRAMTPES